MALSFGFYADPGLTQPLTSLAITRPTSGGAPGADRVVYIGSAYDDGRYLSASGSNPIVVSPVELSETGTVLASHVLLAATAEGLDTATPGGPLDLPNRIDGGVSNVVAVHVRVLTPALTAGEYSDVMLQTGNVFEAGV